MSACGSEVRYRRSKRILARDSGKVDPGIGKRPAMLGGKHSGNQPFRDELQQRRSIARMAARAQQLCVFQVRIR